MKNSLSNNLLLLISLSLGFLTYAPNSYTLGFVYLPDFLGGEVGNTELIRKEAITNEFDLSPYGSIKYTIQDVYGNDISEDYSLKNYRRLNLHPSKNIIYVVDSFNKNRAKKKFQRFCGSLDKIKINVGEFNIGNVLNISVDPFRHRKLTTPPILITSKNSSVYVIFLCQESKVITVNDYNYH